VVFGDINLSEQQIRGNYNPGAGGWPTIRYFNAATGYDGAPYPKKTDKAMCDELGDDTYMTSYVEEQGWTTLCSVADGSNCSEKQVDFIGKWKVKGVPEVEAQLKRLRGMTKDAKSLKPELAAWLGQRIGILIQLQQAGEATVKEEL